MRCRSTRRVTVHHAVVNGRQRRVRSTWLVLALSLTSCRGAERHVESLQVIVDSAGRYPVVRSVGAAPVWRAESLFVLGASNGGPTEFGSVRSVLLGHAGQLYVVDPTNRVISVFDSTGAFSHRLGRDGAGPGEYRDPYSVAWLGDSLALLDPGNARIGLYDASEHWVTSWRVQQLTGGQFIRLYRTPPTFWAYAIRPAAVGPAGRFIRYTSAGARDTLPFVPTILPDEGARCPGPGRGISFFSAPYAASSISVPTPIGAIATAVTSYYRVSFVGPTGDTSRVIEREIAATPITDAEWTAANAEWIRFRKDWPTAKCSRTDFPRPSRKPFLVSLFFDDVQRLWVEVVTPNGPRYDVFSADGRLLATVAGLPESDGIDPSIAGNRIALVGRGADDTPVVRVYRLTR